MLIPYKTAVDTESNLSARVLREIIFTLGFDYSFYEPKEKLLESKLLKKRNHIAHGEDIDIEDVDYDELHATVIELMNCLYNQIENGAVSRSYERPV